VVAGVFGCNQHNIEITRQGAMLKAVIQQMKLWAEAFFREQPSLVSILTHNHWHAEAPCQEQRLVAKVPG
jgi:hypothetical protein